MKAEKECSKCHKVKPFSEFTTQGLQLRLHSWCKACVNTKNNRRPKPLTAKDHPAIWAALRAYEDSNK